MRSTRRLAKSVVVAGLFSCLAALIRAGPASAATTTLTFKEPEKGSTFAFVDSAPKSELVHGFPTKFSAGDQFIFTNPLEAEGKIVGKLRVVCVATQNASSKHFDAAGFNCTGISKIPGGTLVFVARSMKATARKARPSAAAASTPEHGAPSSPRKASTALPSR